MMTEQQHASDADQQNSDDAIERLRSKPRRPPGPNLAPSKLPQSKLTIINRWAATAESGTAEARKNKAES